MRKSINSDITKPSSIAIKSLPNKSPNTTTDITAVPDSIGVVRKLICLTIFSDNDLSFLIRGKILLYASGIRIPSTK